MEIGPGLFFTGTDTGVGKTFVASAVTRLLRRQGRPVAVCKPVASGAALIDGRWVSEDTLRLARAAGHADDLDGVTPWSFAEPLAPAVAARRQGISLTLQELSRAVRVRGEGGKALVVEGVGGLLCPITDRETVADLAGALKLPVVVVVRRALGTLNHTLLTLDAARARGIIVAGIVVNETTATRGVAEETNIEELQRWIDVPLLAVVPYLAESKSEELTALAPVDWWQLCHLISGRT